MDRDPAGVDFVRESLIEKLHRGQQLGNGGEFGFGQGLSTSSRVQRLRHGVRHPLHSSLAIGLRSREHDDEDGQKESDEISIRNQPALVIFRGGSVQPHAGHQTSAAAGSAVAAVP